VAQVVNGLRRHAPVAGRLRGGEDRVKARDGALDAVHAGEVREPIPEGSSRTERAVAWRKKDPAQ
jgi:hypothetical protein